MFICQVLCTGIEGSLLLYLEGPSAKVCSSAKFCVLVLKASLLYYLWHPSAKYVHLQRLLYEYSRQLFSIQDGWGSIGQSRFVCLFRCTGYQCIYTLLPGGSIGQSSSANLGVIVFKASLLS